MKTKTGMAGLLVLLLYGPVSAGDKPSLLIEGGMQSLIYDVGRVSLDVSDQVSDGCMPRPDAVRASAEAALRRNNFSVVEPESALFVPSVQVVALGYATGDYSCAVSFNVRLIKYIGASVPHSASGGESTRTTITPFEINVYSTLLTGTKSDMQDRLEREAEKGANDIFILIDRARDHVRNNWPELWRSAHGS